MRNREAVAYGAYVVLGVISGVIALLCFEVRIWGPPPPPQRVGVLMLFWSGVWPFVMLVVGQALSRQYGVLAGLAVTLPMYLTFATVFMHGGGSFVAPFAYMPISGVVIGPLAGMVARRLTVARAR